MGVISDLHIHSRFSRACSKNITVENLAKYGKIKGINLLGTGDFTHPEWLKELKEKLKDCGKGVYEHDGMKFILSTEISLIYTREKGRRVHLVILAPGFEAVDRINKWLDTKGRRDYDGRPIFNFSCVELVEKLIGINDMIEIIPAHIWTPWFGIFGSMTGFNSLKEAFEDKEKDVHAIETGMSSNPEMNWRISELNGKSIISFSDAHSFWPWRLGREATIFRGESSEISYKDIVEQIRNNSFESTIETNPAYGKYHFDGHRLCNFSCSPEEAKKLGNICPACKKQMTIGVEHRVEELSNQKARPKNAKPFFEILPLHEIISLVKGTSIFSKSCWSHYNRFIEEFGNEFNVLLNAKKESLIKIDDKIAEAVMLNREGKIKVIPGYDGEYGKAVLKEKQTKLI